jgi:ATP-dependent Clp protease, protease subunit
MRAALLILCALCPVVAFVAPAVPSQARRPAAATAASMSIYPNNMYQPNMMPDPQPEKPEGPTPPRRTPVNMPTVGEGKDQMDVVSRLFKDRILLLGSEVTDEVGNVLVAQLLYLAQNDPKKDITLYINSPGGSVSAGLAIYDTMQVLC